MNKQIIALIAYVGLAGSPASQATSYTYLTLTAPNATFTYAEAINNHGQVAGYFQDGTGQHGFIYSGGSYTALDAPNASATDAKAINNQGQVAGSFQDGSGQHGFVYSGGSYTVLNVPNASSTIAYDISNEGQVVGSYQDSSGQHAFLYSGGSFIPLGIPGVILNIPFYGIFPGAPFVINDSGQVVGNYSDGNGTHGFLYSGGSYVTLDNPYLPSPMGFGSYNVGTAATGINNQSQVVGLSDQESNLAPGASYYDFFYDNGTYTDASGTYPGAVFGITDNGQVWGIQYSSLSPYQFAFHGYIYSNGNTTTLNDPDAGSGDPMFGWRIEGTLPLAVNNQGQAVGYFYDKNQNQQAFLASPVTAARIDCWFDWEESHHPDLYAPAGAGTQTENYAYRAYQYSKTYLGIYAPHSELFYLGPDGKLLDRGPLSEMLSGANCQTSPNVNECMFNWAEATYPRNFVPAGSATQNGTYIYRFYSYTQTYLGVTSFNDHAYSRKVGGLVQDLGSVANLVAQAGCN